MQDNTKMKNALSLSINSEAKVPGGAQVGDFDDKSSRLACNANAIEEILLRLPTKSLIRFKLVRKEWLSLISSDEFCHLHTLRHSELQPSLILKSHTLQSWYFSPISNDINLVTPYTFPFRYPVIMGSCNGLLLLQSDDPGNSFHVYNPTTKQSRKISLTDTHSTKYPILALAFDPSKSPHYKIVCIKSTMEHFSSPFDMHTYYIEVYDSESHTWKLSLELSSKQIEISHGVYCDGSVYWDSHTKVYYFDIAKNVFRTFPRPIYPPTQNHERIKTSTSYLQESNGHLYHSSLVSDGKCEAVAVWELLLRDDDIHSPWLLKHHNVLSLPPLPVGSPNFTRHLRIIKGSLDTEACRLVFQRSWKICVYSFLDKSLKELVDLASEPFCSEWHSFRGYEFGESLAVV